jgi:hypothetical protein
MRYVVYYLKRHGSGGGGGCSMQHLISYFVRSSVTG